MGEQLQLEDEEVNITLRRAWDRALRGLATRVNKPTFEAHIRTLKPVALTEETPDSGGPAVTVITLGVPSAFTREWVEKRHAPLIQGLLEEILDRDVRLKFVQTPKASGAGPAAGARTLSLFGEEDPAAAAEISVALASEVSQPGPASWTDRGDYPDDEDLPPIPIRGGMPDPAVTVAAAAPARRPAVKPAGRPGQGSSARTGGASTAYSHLEGPPLNSRYTFENFVTGTSNRLAHAGARAVAQAPGQVYNPLFLYGPPGLGKTHLMHAIGNEVLATRGLDPSRVAYVSGEAFATDFISSLRQQRTDEFRRAWRSVDLWLVDDIQFIAGKEATKEEFFHTFNTLYQMGKQIVFSSDRSPRELRAMDERLRSRFESGLIADITPPDLETRLAILHKKSEAEGMRIPDEVLLYMARLVQSNIRTLEGALVKLVAYASVVNSPVTTELASSILERYYVTANGGVGDDEADTGSPAATDGAPPAFADGPSGPDRRPTAGRRNGAYRLSAGGATITAELVQRVVAKRFGLSTDALTGKKRDREVVTARQVAMLLMRELTEMSLQGIGQVFGGRDHTTVLHACDRMRSQMPFDDDLRSLVEDLATQLRAQAAG